MTELEKYSLCDSFYELRVCVGYRMEMMEETERISSNGRSNVTVSKLHKDYVLTAGRKIILHFVIISKLIRLNGKRLSAVYVLTSLSSVSSSFPL